MNKLLANVIWFLHVLFILSMIIIPFTNNEFLLNMYILIIPFLFFHWATNDDNCCLTVMECKLRGIPKSNTFMNNLISPIYTLPNHITGVLTKMITLLLFYYVLYKRKAIKLIVK